MKQATNFRLDENILTTIALLAKDFHTRKTDIIEQAVLQFAGTWATNEADTILNTIKADKSNKDVDLLL